MLPSQMQSLRHVTTAHLAQTMTLLSLAVDELRQQIDSELSTNPALEMLEERRCPVCQRPLPAKGPCPVCSCPNEVDSNDPIVYISPREDFYSKGDMFEDDDFKDGPSTPDNEDLPTYVLKQIVGEFDKNSQKIGAFLLVNLNEDGFLKIELIEAARYFNVPLSQVERVHQAIMHADPPGVGARNPKEALLVQIEMLEETGIVPPFVKLVVEEGMDLLSRHQYSTLAKQLDASLKQIKLAATFIQDNLNPYPARAHWGEQSHHPSDRSNVFHQPDVIISVVNNGKENRLFVEVILPLCGTLQINPMFRQAIRGAEEDSRYDMKMDLEKASLFVKCLQQRNHTMLRLMQQVVTTQKEFILHGDKHLKPITRAHISKELEVHESTISRAVANKAVQLPNGRIIPLASFFDRSLNIRTVLKTIIENEPRPLSDTELSGLLVKEGFEVARRTVAKYRAMERILPAHLRTSVVRK